MPPPLKHLEGHRFGKLTAISRAGFREGKKSRKTLWFCRCDCGNERVVAQVDLVAGNTKSCGCIVGKHKRTHGMTNTPEFRAWDSMRRRCNNPQDRRYKDYGARGIRVCERWDGFEAFFADMGLRPSQKHSLDRIKNSENYEPGNCRWADDFVQCNNRRSSLVIEWNGERRTAAEWERYFGHKPGLVSKRLSMGWTVTRALTQPSARLQARRGTCAATTAPGVMYG